jgi:type II secretory pathway pseudopilin PulG
MQQVSERRANRLPVAGRSCAGFTYLGVLFAVALMGAMLAAIATIWHQVQQREKEKQLLFVGKQFRQAITAYYENTPGLAKQFPKKLEDLLDDKRFPFTRRYLRKIFYDPFTGSTDWGLLKDAGGGITGVYSRSDDEPLKKANFGARFAQFDGKNHYSDWQFVYSPDAAAGATTAAQNEDGMPASAPVPHETIPPEYVAPPPTLDSGSPDGHKKRLCDVMHGTDLRACLNMAKKFGDAAGANCLASAASRYSACLKSDPLPPLAVQYK